MTLFLPQCSSADLRHIRETFKQFLTPLPFTEKTTLLLVLALDEACANILRHAYKNQTTGAIRLKFIPLKTKIHILVRDYGKPCDPSCIKGRSLEDFRPGGLGVHLIQQAFEEVKYQARPRGTLLSLKKSFRRNE